MIETLLIVATALIIGTIVYFETHRKGQETDMRLPEENARLKAELEQHIKQTGQLEAQLDQERNDKNVLQGRSKQMFADFAKLEAKLEALNADRDTLKKRVTQFETDDQRRQKELERQVTEMTNAKKSFEDERQRIISEDVEERQHREEERDRIWNEHEKSVIAILTDLCKQPQYSFSCYTNVNLPPELADGSLKPDFMIEFLGQYVIFDAKKSKSESLQTYITNTIKKTVQKVKGNDKIAPFIYLVVPTEAIAELRSHYYVHEGFTLYVISPEALAPILAGLKKITTYEFAEQMDPQQRENIVQLIAELDFHINLRNAADIVLTKMGADLLEKAQRTDPKMAEEVALKKQPMNAKASIAAGDLKKLVSQLTTQSLEVQKLVSPRASVQGKSLKDAEKVLEESLF